jgi:hypothetical protein
LASRSTSVAGIEHLSKRFCGQPVVRDVSPPLFALYLVL